MRRVLGMALLSSPVIVFLAMAWIIEGWWMPTVVVTGSIATFGVLRVGLDLLTEEPRRRHLASVSDLRARREGR